MAAGPYLVSVFWMLLVPKRRWASVKRPCWSAGPDHGAAPVRPRGEEQPDRQPQEPQHLPYDGQQRQRAGAGASGRLAGTTDSAFSSSAIDKFALRLLYVAVAVGACAFLEGLCWTQTAERQASRMRRLYMEAVLRQQLPNVLANMTLFFGALVVAFVFAWLLAPAGLPFMLLFVAPSVVLGKRMAAAAGEARAAYKEAGGVAEQAVSSIRTVVSYRGERQTLERFGRALARSTALGIKRGSSRAPSSGAWASCTPSGPSCPRSAASSSSVSTRRADTS
ncbi:ABC transporter B family member 15-like [Miscanthus floridulus]|uniref:ABC transporter B family member 15-like n=1 Tax=Miscanthus floridulus TaxID=154761 RepID=UPI003457E9AF